MNKIYSYYVLSIAILSCLFFSCSTNDVDEIPVKDTDDYYEITDEAFGEYLVYLQAAGVEKIEQLAADSVTKVYKYRVDTIVSQKQTAALEMPKSAAAITTLQTAGLTTASVKITNVDGLQYFVNTIGITFTSNEIETIDLTKLTKLETINLNNNFIASLDLTKNITLKTLNYTGSSKATVAQQLTTINLSYNVNLTSVNLSKHANSPFPIPAAIFNNLTTAQGVVSE